jgi:hypothetical protein
MHLGTDMNPLIQVEFTHKHTGAKIIFDSIYTSDNGDLMQYYISMH